MTETHWDRRCGICGIVLSVLFYVYYLPNMAPDMRRFSHNFHAARASLAGVLRNGDPATRRIGDDPRLSYLEPITVRRKFMHASIVPEARVVSGSSDEEESPVGLPEEATLEINSQIPSPMNSQIPTPSLSILSQTSEGGPMGQSSGLSTIEEFLALDEQAFETDEVDLAIPELSEDTGHGAAFTFRTHKSRRGETIRKIAALYQGNVEQLEIINGCKADRLLSSGDDIIVPVGLGSFHVVSKKDNLWTVARHYNLKPSTILFFNKGKQVDLRLFTGERIFVPLGAIDVRDARVIAANRTIRNILENKLAFCWPLKGRLTSKYGWRIHPIFHRGRKHQGIDLAVPTGTSIRAAERGRVVWSGWRGGAGKCVMIEHPNGMYSIYAHCSRLLTSRGSWVSRRQVIAKVGDTGLSTGPHLHFALKRDDNSINPLKYLPAASF